MAFITDQEINTGSFVSINQDWLLEQIKVIGATYPEFTPLLTSLYQNNNDLAISLNTRRAGFYLLQEFVDGNLWFNRTSTSILDRRQEFCRVVDFGTLPNTGLKSVPHGITVTNKFNWTNIYGSATDTTGLTGINLSYASPVLVNNIELFVDATNVNVITGSDRSNYNICTIVLEYVKF